MTIRSRKTASRDRYRDEGRVLLKESAIWVFPGDKKRVENYLERLLKAARKRRDEEYRLIRARKTED